MKKQSLTELKGFLEEAVIKYNRPSFIASDPISVPHRFVRKEDIEISGLFAALFAWGKRTTSIQKANELMDLMDGSPYQFIINADPIDFKRFNSFVHRTFQSDDVLFFISALKEVYKKYNSLEPIFSKQMNLGNPANAIHNFKFQMLAFPHLKRSEKHLSDPIKGSSAKRINMFLRWMVRKDKKGVDFGIWNSIKPSSLMLPLDVHSGNVARKLGILRRTQNDWKAVEEVTSTLIQLDPEDPAKYDFALFNLGINKIL